MTKTAIVFPGQGAQSVGMGRDVVDQSPRARAVFEKANDVVGYDLMRVCFDGPASELEKTDVQQPAIFTTSIAIWEAFVEAGGERRQFVSAAGLSLGEYSALCVAGALKFEEGLELVRRRGQLMQAAAEASSSGMVSLVGADQAIAEALCDEARKGDVLVCANFNCPGQVVISGSSEACARAQELAGQFECRAVALAVAGAFHSPLMKSAADGLRPVLDGVTIQSLELPVMANVSATYHGDAAAIRASLQQQVDHPVQWQRCVERMIADGVARFVEIGPGRILKGLLRKIDRRVTVVNVNTAEGIADALPSVAG